MKKILMTLFLGILLSVFCYPADEVQAAQAQQEKVQEDESAEISQELTDQFDFEEIEQFLKKLFPESKTGFEELVKSLTSGDVEAMLETFIKMVTDQFFYEFKTTKTTMVNIMAIIIIAAIFHNFSSVFQSGQVSELGFYVLYMLMITLCLNSFRLLLTSALEGLGMLLGFLKLLGPVYFLAVAFATGSATSIAFYNMILILICIVEMVIQSFLLPLVQVYMIIRILNNLSIESYLSKFGELLHTVITWALRTLLGSVIGINLIQSLLSPAIDSVKRSVLTRGGEALPFVGNVIGGAAEVVLGTAVLLKNGIGIAGAFICIAICMAPVVQMTVVTLLYKLTAALVQPISDKRMVECISSMADGTSMLLRVLFTSCLLFLITIAMVAVTTS